MITCGLWFVRVTLVLACIKLVPFAVAHSGLAVGGVAVLIVATGRVIAWEAEGLQALWKARHALARLGRDARV